MKFKIPNINKIIIPRWSHNLGEGVNERGWNTQKFWSQGTIPKDPKILDILGIKKKDKVLAIAGFYGDWANAIKKAGAIVDYSDVSMPIVNYVKKQKNRKFNKYIVSGYELIPKNEKHYDWTFTYEACGGGRGLPIAYLRSLLNNKGGILMLHFSTFKPQSIKPKLIKYPRITKQLEKAYGAKSVNIKKKIKAYRKGKKELNSLTYCIYKIITNDKARELAKKDIEFLFRTGNKRVFTKKDKDSLKRLSILAKANGEKMRREVEIK